MKIFSVPLLLSAIAPATTPGSVIAGEDCGQGPLAEVRHLFENADADGDRAAIGGCFVE